MMCHWRAPNAMSITVKMCSKLNSCESFENGGAKIFKVYDNKLKRLKRELKEIAVQVDLYIRGFDTSLNFS